jgi:hypothetical protein
VEELQPEPAALTQVEVGDGDRLRPDLFDAATTERGPQARSVEFEVRLLERPHRSLRALQFPAATPSQVSGERELGRHERILGERRAGHDVLPVEADRRRCKRYADGVRPVADRDMEVGPGLAVEPKLRLSFALACLDREDRAPPPVVEGKTGALEPEVNAALRKQTAFEPVTAPLRVVQALPDAPFRVGEVSARVRVPRLAAWGDEYQHVARRAPRSNLVVGSRRRGAVQDCASASAST